MPLLLILHCTHCTFVRIDVTNDSKTSMTRNPTRPSYCYGGFEINVCSCCIALREKTLPESCHRSVQGNELVEDWPLSFVLPGSFFRQYLTILFPEAMHGPFQSQSSKISWILSRKFLSTGCFDPNEGFVRGWWLPSLRQTRGDMNHCWRSLLEMTKNHASAWVSHHGSGIVCPNDCFWLFSLSTSLQKHHEAIGVGDALEKVRDTM